MLLDRDLAPRPEHLDALTRVVECRRRYLGGSGLTISDLRRSIADTFDSGLLASLRPVREALLNLHRTR
jgi:hypothetical protein